MGSRTDLTYRIDPDSPVRTQAALMGTLQDFYRDNPSVGIAAGYYDRVSGIHKFGHNGDVGATWETLWDNSGIYVYPTTALSMLASSDNVNDTSAGSGAQTVQFEGLDGKRRPLTAIVSMNGRTQVALPPQFFRVFRARVLTSGASGWNEGIIYIGTGAPTTGKPAVVYGLIEPFAGQSLMSIYTIPMDSEGYTLQTLMLSSVAKATQAGIFVREIGGTFQIKEFVPVYSGEAIQQDRVSEIIPPGADVEMRARASAGGGDVGGQFEIALIKLPK